jgi:H+/Cl- antiporter ClcA
MLPNILNFAIFTLFALIFTAIAIIVLYFIIRKAVGDAIKDAIPHLKNNKKEMEATNDYTK